MKDNSTDDTVIDRLQGALDGDALPKAAREYANHLLKRLSSPVRVAILGNPKSGKSELINMFAGRRLIPKDARLPTTEVVYGDAESMTVTSVDGTVRADLPLDLAGVAASSAAFLRIEAPIPILQRISLLEVVTDGKAAELKSAVDWSVRRTEIALWCSQSFDAGERAIWTRVPDSLKDHAFLVLTKADALSAEKVLSQRVAALETVVAEEFHSLFAVATLQAIKAHRSGVMDEAMYHASGGGALTAEILRHAERGRRADFDSAHMFLARYHIDAAPRGAKAAKAPEAAKTAGVPETPEKVTEIATSVASPVPAPVLAPTPMPTPATATISNVTLFADSVRFLKRRGDSLGASAAELGEGHAKGLLDQCVDAVEHLVDLFSRDETGCEAADAFIDELAEAADIMVLMQVETGDAPAADAVTLLLQLRREMEMKLAA
jgi:hypothetical protein